MTNILHIVDPGTPGGGGCTLRLVADLAGRMTGVRHEVVVLGTHAHGRLARRCGLRPVAVIAPPLGEPALARGLLARAVRRSEAAGGPCDLVHAWTLRAAAAVARGLPRRRLVTTLTAGPVSAGCGRRLGRVLGRAGDGSPAPVLVTSTAVRAEWEAIGVDPAALSVFHPAVGVDLVNQADRAALRERWGAGDGTFVVGLLAEPLGLADATTAVTIISRVATTGRDVRVVLHPKARRRPGAEEWTGRLGYRGHIIVDDAIAEPWRIACGLDAALVLGGPRSGSGVSGAGWPWALLTGDGRRLPPRAGILPALWMMAAGVPVVAEASGALPEVLEDGRTALLFPSGDAHAACARIMRIHDDADLARRLGGAGLAEVRSRYDSGPGAERLARVYDAVLNG